MNSDYSLCLILLCTGNIEFCHKLDRAQCLQKASTSYFVIEFSFVVGNIRNSSCCEFSRTFNTAILNTVATGWHKAGKVRNWHFLAQCLFLLNILVACYIDITVSEEFFASVFGVFQEWTLHRTLTGLPWRQGQQVHSSVSTLKMEVACSIETSVACLLKHMVSYARRLRSLPSPLWEPQIWHLFFFSQYEVRPVSSQLSVGMRSDCVLGILVLLKNNWDSRIFSRKLELLLPPPIFHTKPRPDCPFFPETKDSRRRIEYQQSSAILRTEIHHWGGHNTRW
jgi:hypothetical protein